MSVVLRVHLPDAKATGQLGAAVAELLQGGETVLLLGELGAGKTTLTKGLVAALGGSGEVTSPTFTLMHWYESEPPVAHVDCWRLRDLAEVADLGLEELLDEGAVAVVEWGELAAPLLGEDALVVTLTIVEGEGDDLARSAHLRPSGASWEAQMRHLQALVRASGLAVEEATSPEDERPDPGAAR